MQREERQNNVLPRCRDVRREITYPPLGLQKCERRSDRTMVPFTANKSGSALQALFTIRARVSLRSSCADGHHCRS